MNLRGAYVPGISFSFNAWQYLCIRRNHGVTSLFNRVNATVSHTDAEIDSNIVSWTFGGNHGYIGMLDDVWVFNVSLSPQEMNTLYLQEGYAVELDGNQSFAVITTEVRGGEYRHSNGKLSW